MKTYFFISLILVFLSGCASSPLDRSHDSKIIGVWHLMDYGDGNYGYSQLGFTPDGRKCVISVEMSRYGLPSTNYYSSTWKIENNILISTVGNSPSSSLPKGYVIEDEILLLDDQKMNLIMRVPAPSEPRIEKHQKLHEVNPERICEVVENYAKIKQFRIYKSIS